MVKTFKKLAALTAAVALVGSFAVSASAVNVSTTTTYSTAGEIMVTSVVSDIVGTDTQVTYYATNDKAEDTNGIVYIDQKRVDEYGKATFAYKTNASYVGSEIKVNYTASEEAPNVGVIPAALDNAVTEVSGLVLDAGSIVSESERKLTVIGKVTGDVSDYGVIVTTEEIASGNSAALPEGAYKAMARANGTFAVQLIDEEEEGTFVQAGATYNIAVYYKVGDTYTIEASDQTVTIGQ